MFALLSPRVVLNSFQAAISPCRDGSRRSRIEPQHRQRLEPRQRVTPGEVIAARWVDLVVATTRQDRRAIGVEDIEFVDDDAWIDFLSTLVGDELLRRQDRLLARRIQQAGFRDPGKTLDTFDFDFNKKLPRRLVFELATGHFVAQHADGLLLGPPGTGKSHLAQAIGFAVIQQGHRVCYREAHVLLDELADAQLAGTRKEYLHHVTTVPLLIIDDLGMKRLPHTAAEDLLEIVMRRYERASTLITSNRPVEDWGKLLGDTAAVTALLDRLLHHAHALTCGPRSWRTRLQGERNPS